MLRFLVSSFLAFLILPQMAFAQVGDFDNAEGGAPILGDWRVSLFSAVSYSNYRAYWVPEKWPKAISDYSYLSFNKNINSEQRISVRIPFNFNTEGQNSMGYDLPSEWNINDVHFVLTDYNWGHLGDIDFQGRVKLYLPTSESSQNRKTAARFQVEAIAEYTIAPRWNVEYIFKPDIYWQHQTVGLHDEAAFRYDGTYTFDPRRTNRQYSLEQSLSLEYLINKYFAVDTGMGLNENWTYSSAVENLQGDHTTDGQVFVGLQFKYERYWSRFGVTNGKPLGSNRGQSVEFFLPENTEYSLLLNINLF